MTMGPLPRIMIFLRSVRLGMGASDFSFFDQLAESGEEVTAVERAGRGLGVVLDAEEGPVAVLEAFEGIVVEVPVGNFAGFGQGRGVDAEAVVLGGDFDAAGGFVADGVVAAAVAELELVGSGAEGEGEELMAEADAEEGNLAGEGAQGVDAIGDGGGVAGTVGAEDAVRT
jgi:hypothetical protein